MVPICGGMLGPQAMAALSVSGPETPYLRRREMMLASCAPRLLATIKTGYFVTASEVEQDPGVVRPGGRGHRRC